MPRTPGLVALALCFTLYAGEPVTLERVKPLYEQLNDDAFEVREAAVQKLLKLGAEIEPHLKTLEVNPSPEQKTRLNHLRLHLESESIHTVQGLIDRRDALVKSIVEPDAADAATIHAVVIRIERLYERIEKIAPADELSLKQAEFSYAVGEAFYKKFRNPAQRRIWVYKALPWLERAEKTYGMLSERLPDDKNLRDQLHRASMIRYACVRFMPIEGPDE